MKKTIYKYSLSTADIQDVLVPKGSELLTIQSQKNNPCAWFLVNPNLPIDETETFTIEIFCTGHEVHYDMGVDRKYISTFQLYDGELVFHAFNRMN